MIGWLDENKHIIFILLILVILGVGIWQWRSVCVQYGERLYQIEVYKAKMDRLAVFNPKKAEDYVREYEEVASLLSKIALRSTATPADLQNFMYYYIYSALKQSGASDWQSVAVSLGKDRRSGLRDVRVRLSDVGSFSSYSQVLDFLRKFEDMPYICKELSVDVALKEGSYLVSMDLSCPLYDYSYGGGEK